MGGGEHVAFVYKKSIYKNTSNEHTYDKKLRNISSCSVDNEEYIKQQICCMDEIISRNHSSTSPSLQSSSIADNKTHDSPSTQQSHLLRSNVP